MEQYPDGGACVSQSETWEPEDLDINLISNRQLLTSVQGNYCMLFSIAMRIPSVQ